MKGLSFESKSSIARLLKSSSILKVAKCKLFIARQIRLVECEDLVRSRTEQICSEYIYITVSTVTHGHRFGVSDAMALAPSLK